MCDQGELFVSSDLVFLDPAFATEVLKPLVEHWLSKDKAKPDVVAFVKQQGHGNVQKLLEAVDALVHRGEVREVLLPFLWRSLGATLRREDYESVLRMLVDGGVLYEEQRTSVGSDAAAEGQRSWVMPMRLPADRPDGVEEWWAGDGASGAMELRMQYELYDGVVPPGVPERSVAGCLALGKPIGSCVWQRGALFAPRADTKALLEVQNASGSAWLVVKVRGKALDQWLWQTMEAVVQSVAKVLAEFAGLLPGRTLVCPACIQRGEAEPGSWDPDELSGTDATGECKELCERCPGGQWVQLRPPKPPPLKRDSTRRLLMELKTGQEALHADVREIKLDMKTALSMLRAQSTMLATLLHAADNLAPRLIAFLPADDKPAAGSRKLPSPKDWFNQRVRIFFVDPIRYRLAPTNPGEDGVGRGFELEFPKAWVVKAMPYVKLGVATLRVAHVASKLAGFPIPDVGGWLDAQLEALGECKDEALKAMAEMTADEATATEVLRQVEDRCERMLRGKLEEAAVEEGAAALGEKLKEPLERSLGELDQLLAAKHPQWKEQCGLVKAVAKDADGATEWVLQDDVADFERWGRAMLEKAEQAQSTPPTPSPSGPPAGADTARSASKSRTVSMERGESVKAIAAYLTGPCNIPRAQAGQYADKLIEHGCSEVADLREITSEQWEELVKPPLHRKRILDKLAATKLKKSNSTLSAEVAAGLAEPEEAPTAEAPIEAGDVQVHAAKATVGGCCMVL